VVLVVLLLLLLLLLLIIIRRRIRIIVYVWVQEELHNKFYCINKQDTKTSEDLDDVRKMTSEMEQAMVAYLEVVDDDDD
jgi:hypothetical protein